MFGINDNNQNTNSTGAADKPTDGAPALPPSPFMDTQADKPASSDSLASAPAPAADNSQPHTDQMSIDSAPASASPDPALVSLKEQALNSLAPLVGHLDQTPEEKFKTTMMLIQASDNSSLVKEAYEAANQIADEKARAQALLDVVNEINYFTQKDSPEDKV
ncbi:hypothetical protein KW801_02815 [Candidatus Saccharibacteria bacterium]|nr:hypothetical protein [Candidatus Saccharibacteria bacterium]